MAERKLKIPKDGIAHECLDNDNTIVVFMQNSKPYEIYFGNRDLPKDGWLVISYSDLLKAIRKAKDNGRT